MYATTLAEEAVQARLSARPRPFSSRWTTPTCCGSLWCMRRAMASVRSVLALSATVTFQVNDTFLRSHWESSVTARPISSSSL